MAWFKVDDRLHNHRKARNVLRSDATKRRDAAPMGLWALAGSWCGQNRTNGFVPTDVLEDWDDNATTLASRLVDAGLWRVDEVGGEPGYRFHDWAERNPTGGDSAPTLSSAGGFANHIRWHKKRGKMVPDCPHCYPIDPSESDGLRSDESDRIGSPSDLCSNASDDSSTDDDLANPQVIPGDPNGIRSESDPIPPVPVPEPERSGGYVSRERYDAQTRAIANDPPPAHCTRHPNGTADACGDCRTARLADEHARKQNLQAAKDARQAERDEQAAATRAAINDCELCNEAGYRAGRVCAHDPEADARNARGRAAVQAALDARKSA